MKDKVTLLEDAQGQIEYAYSAETIDSIAHAQLAIANALLLIYQKLHKMNERAETATGKWGLEWEAHHE